MVNTANPQMIFISYSRSDINSVSKLISDLQQHGINVWIDKRGLKPGTRNWEQVLRDAISSSWAVILVASPDSRRSNYVQDELSIAEMYKRPVFPIWVAGSEWMDCIPMGMGKIQYIDARAERYTIGLSELVDSLNNTPATGPVIVESPITQDFVPRNPYKGLAPFRSEDSGDFFGREKLIAAFVERIKSTQQKNAARFLAVVGPSGSGKSSAVMAGLLPRLQAGVLRDSANWVYLQPMMPGTNPVKSLAITLSRVLPMKSIKTIHEDLEDVSGLSLIAQSLISPSSSQVVLVVDQFEELFTQTVSGQVRQQFIDLLITAVTEPTSPLIVIITLRADFYDRPMNYAAFLNLLKEHSELVPPMSLTDLREVIEKPTELPDVQMVFDPGLVAELVFEVRDQVGGLPLLQFTLDQLFQMRDGKLMTQAAYEEIGGVKGALARHAEATYLTLPTDEHRRLAQALFLRLVELGTTEQETTRHRATYSELTLSDTRQSQIIQEAAMHFVQARLLTTNRLGATTTIEVSHETLIREWVRLGEWLKNARDDIHIQTTISRDATEWVMRGRKADDDGLYRGTVLQNAQNWAKRSIPSVEEMAFIDSGNRVEIERRKNDEIRTRQVRNFGRAVAILSLFAVIAIIVMLLSTLQAINANNQSTTATIAQGKAVDQVNIAGLTLQVVNNQRLTATIAQGQAVGTAALAAKQAQIVGATSTRVGLTLAAAQLALTPAAQEIQNANSVELSIRLGSEANNLLQLTGGNAETAALLSIRALRSAYSSPADSALAKSSLLLYTRLSYTEHAGELTSIAMSPNGKTVITGSMDGTARIWAASSGETRLILQNNYSGVLAVAFSPDGKTVLTGGTDGKARLWDADSGMLKQTFDGHSAPIRVVTFDPADGKIILTGSEDGTVYVWNIEDGVILSKFLDHHAAIVGAAILPNGQYAITTGEDRFVRIWNIKDATTLNYFDLGVSEKVNIPVAIAPNGKWAIVAVGMGFYLIELPSFSVIQVYSEHTGLVIGLAVSPDSQQIASSSADGTIRLWSPNHDKSLRIFTGHTAWVTSVAFSSDGQTIASASKDKTARLWNIGDNFNRDIISDPLIGEKAQFSPDGQTLLVAQTNNTVGLWDVQTHNLIQTYVGHTATVTAISFSPDGKYVLTGSFDHTIRLWDLGTGSQLRVFEGHTDQIWAIAFSPDGKTILSGSSDKTAKLWDVATGLVIQTFNHDTRVISVAYSPDGHTFLTGIGRPNDVAYLWDSSQYILHSSSPNEPVSSKDALKTLVHADEVSAAVFSPDGTIVVTGSYNGEIRIWKTSNGTEIRKQESPLIAGRDRWITNATFSLDGKYLLSSSSDGSVQVWDSSTGHLLRLLVTRDGIVRGVSFGPDGRHFLTSGLNTIHFWSIDSAETIANVCSRLVRDLTIIERQRYSITDMTPTCLPVTSPSRSTPTLEIGNTMSTMTWTPIPLYSTKIADLADSNKKWDNIGKALDSRAQRVYGPLNGHLDQAAFDSALTNIHVHDFILEVDLKYDPQVIPIFQFRTDVINATYALLLYPASNDGVSPMWRLYWGSGGLSVSEINNGIIENFNITIGSVNHVRIIVRGDTAQFFFNEERINNIDLPHQQSSGTVSLGYYLADVTKQSGKLIFEDFVIWSLDVKTPSTSTPVDQAVGLQATTIAANATHQTNAQILAMNTAATSIDGSANLIFGPESGILNYSSEISESVSYPLRLDPLSDFIASIRLYNPPNSANRDWYYGLDFRITEQHSYAIVIYSDQSWSLRETGSDEALMGNSSTYIDNSPGGSNFIRIWVKGNNLYLYINNHLENPSNPMLVSNKDAGKIEVFVSNSSMATLIGIITTYDSLAIWSVNQLPTPTVVGLDDNILSVAPSARRIYGPSKGKFDHSSSTNHSERVYYPLNDFISEVTVYVPYDHDPNLWDFYYVFSDPVNEKYYAVTIDSTRKWILYEITSSNVTAITTMPIPNLRLDVGAANKFRIIVQGGNFSFDVNENRVKKGIRLPRFKGTNYVSINIGVNQQNLLPNAVTRYDDFAIWSLQSDVQNTMVPTASPTFVDSAVIPGEARDN